MTNELCASACAADNNTYSGTEAAGYCFCGDDHDYSKHGTSDICTRTCHGDSTQICGGHWAISIYVNIFDQVHLYTSYEDYWIPVDLLPLAMPVAIKDFHGCLRDCLFDGILNPKAVNSGSQDCHCFTDDNQAVMEPKERAFYHEYLRVAEKASTFIMRQKSGMTGHLSIAKDPSLRVMEVLLGDVQNVRVGSRVKCAHLCYIDAECDLFIFDVVSDTNLLCSIYKMI